MRYAALASIMARLRPWLILVALTSFCYTQSSLRFESLSLNQGISHNMVYCITQDHTGVIWFGSMYGLIRYDGHSYKTFTNDPNDSLSISNNDVISVFEDSKGDLWIGTWGGGLNRFVREIAVFERFLADSTGGAIGGNSIWSVAETGSGKNRQLWFAGAGDGLFRTPLLSGNGTRQFERVELNRELPVRVVQTLHVSSDSILRVGTNNGIFEIKDSVVTGYLPLLSGKKAAERGIFVRTMFEDNKKRLWVGTLGTGLVVLSPDEAGTRKQQFTTTKNPASLPANSINAITQDKRGYIWIGTQHGLSRIHPDSLEQGKFQNSYYDALKPGTLSSNQVGSLLSDRSGILWIGSYMGGVDRFIPWKNKFDKLQHDPYNEASLPGRNVLALTQAEDGRLWIATEGGQLSVSNGPFRGDISSVRFENRSERLKKALGRPYPITALAETFDSQSGKSLWVGTVNGLLRLGVDGTTGVYTKENGLTSASISDLETGSEGDLWIATAGGVNRLNLSSGEIKQYRHDPQNKHSLVQNWTLSLFRDDDGRMWIGSYGGLSLYREKSDDFQNFRHQLDNPQSLPSNYIYSLEQAENGMLWVGTSAGLALLNPASGYSENLGLKDGLANMVICGVGKLSDGNLWISSHQGMSRINVLTRHIRNFDIHDGLQGNMFNPGVYARLQDGSLVFGGNNGLNRLTGGTFPDKTEPSEVVIQSFTANGESLPFKNPGLVELDWAQREPVFSFSSLDYTAPEKNRYSWRLAGWENEWSAPVAKNSVSFGKLAAGDYRFELRGYDSAGNPAPETAVVRFRIIAPFWLQTRYQLLALFVMLALGWYVHRLRIRQQVRNARLVARARSLERDWMREKTSRDYHDQMGHHLTKISLYSTLVAQSLNGSSRDRQVQNYLGKITGAAQRLGSDSRDFIWALNPQKDTLADLEQHLNEFAVDLFADSGMDFSISRNDCPKGMVLSMDWRRNVTLIIKEALHNAMKHSHADVVKLEFYCSGGNIRILVCDNGKGFNVSDEEGGNGLDNMQNRASRLGAELIIESAAGIGTIVEFLARLERQAETVRDGQKGRKAVKQ